MLCHLCNQEAETAPCDACLKKAENMAEDTALRFGLKVMECIVAIKNSGYETAAFTVNTDDMGLLVVEVRRKR